MRAVSVMSVVLLLMLPGCATELADETRDESWTGTVTTEGNTTTVVNEAGSVWGGTARLVEEASIGVEVGESAYMLGSVWALWAGADEIYVVDGQIPVVRAYDWDGAHLRDIGAAGQGPGEYVAPSQVFADAAGRLYVQDLSSDRMIVYSRDGEVVDTWTAPEESRLFSDTLTMTLGGEFFARRERWLDPINRVSVEYAQRVGANGAIGEEFPLPAVDFEPAVLTIPIQGREATWGIPYMPYERAEFLPAGAWMVGVPDEYRFEIHQPDGAVTRVRKYWDPVPVSRDEAEWRKRWTTALIRNQVPDFQWNGPEVPGHKPAYDRFVPVFDDRVLVAREGPSRRNDPCDENYEERGSTTEPCYVSDRIWDMFEVEGRYLGEVTFPALRVSRLFMRGDVVLLAVEDEAGTIMVKRYRLVLPGAQ